MSDNERRFTAKALIFTGIAAIAGTVIVLEAAGKIEHSENKDFAPIGEFTAVHVNPGETFRMSRKSSELHAVCENGYLAIAADVDPSFRGILVDYKNRGVRCTRPSPTDRDLATPDPRQAVPGEQDE
ncbi:kinase [Marinobacter fuscus]|uniref:Kinase n=1 Tax=Marinobacter fuscus TaxID=2109942 RepID=A0A2T1K7E1_9GAMM|nr:kinase [Marinobacter fuscus]PSF06017.1 kinase [Marinobacter fuscus]